MVVIGRGEKEREVVGGCRGMGGKEGEREVVMAI